MSIFDNYVLALADFEEKRRCALLILSISAEAKCIFYRPPVASDSYANAVKALKTYLVPKLNAVAEDWSSEISEVYCRVCCVVGTRYYMQVCCPC